MALRAGMADLIKQVRRITNAGKEDYTVGDVTYWRDADIQEVLDRHVDYLVEMPLKWVTTTDTGGTTRYKIAQSPYGYLEGTTSGTAYFYITETGGSIISGSGYTPNYDQGRITFTSDQGGTAYFLTAYSYDVYAAAADIWRERLANFSGWYDFRSDNQTFTRSQAFEHANKMLNLMEQKSGGNVLQYSGDLRVGQFVRTDLM